jgi:hypothetical protein
MEKPLNPANPLANFMRQPKIYIKLPSNGAFWEPGSLEMPETGEFPVYSMTAKDELLLKIPDALMNGQAVVDVIQHCVPNIKNAWAIPSIDLDVVLIAIRIATYGEKMTVPVNDKIDLEYDVDLRYVIDDQMNSIKWDPIIPINTDITVYVKPVDYRQITKSAIQTFETQKILQVANDESLPEAEKVKLFKESFKKLTEVTVDTIAASIFRIDTSQGSTDNPVYIKEFIDNADKDVFNKVQNHIEQMKNQNAIKPLSIPVTDQMREQGITGDTLEVPLVFDPATFFV